MRITELHFICSGLMPSLGKGFATSPYASSKLTHLIDFEFHFRDRIMINASKTIYIMKLDGTLPCTLSLRRQSQGLSVSQEKTLVEKCARQRIFYFQSFPIFTVPLHDLSPHTYKTPSSSPTVHYKRLYQARNG